MDTRHDELITPFVTFANLMLCDLIFCKRKRTLPRHIMEIILIYLKREYLGQVLIFSAGTRMTGRAAITGKCQLYDPATGINRVLSNTYPMSLCNQKVVKLDAGLIFGAGGRFSPQDNYTEKCFLLSLATKEYKECADLPLKISYHALVELGDGRAFLTGGINDTDNSFLDWSLIYDHVSNVWSSTRCLPTTLAEHTMTRLLSDNILICGGHSSIMRPASAKCYIFYARSYYYESVTPMHSPRAGHAAVLLPDYRVMVIGGSFMMTDDDGYSSTPTCEIYDHVRNTWTTVDSMSTARCNHIAVLVGDYVMVIGGSNPNGNLTLSREYFCLKTLKWTSISPSPFETAPPQLSAAIKVDNFIYSFSLASYSCASTLQ